MSLTLENKPLTDAVTQRQRVAILVNHLSSGGAERVAVTLANALSAGGFVVDMLMIQKSDDYFYAASLSPSVTCVSMSPDHNAGLMTTVRALARRMKSMQYAVVFSILERPSIQAIMAAAIAGNQTIVPCVHIDLVGYANSHRSVTKTARRWLLNLGVVLFYRAVQTVVAVSENAKVSAGKLLSPFGPEIQLIYNGFDLDALLDKTRNSVTEEWLVHKDVPVIITCGRLTHQKAHDTLLAAFAMLRKKMPVRLMIIGEGEDENALKRLTTDLAIEGDVLFLGVVEDPVSRFAKSDLFVLSSRSEGLSIVLIEALVAGVPIVSTDCPSGPTEVLAGGRYGRLVAVDDVAALADAMELGLSRPLVFDRSDLERHLERFSLDRMVEKYVDIIDRVEISRTVLAAE